MTDAPLWQDHFPLLVLLGSLVAAFLSTLWRDTPRARIELFLKIWIGLVVGAVAAGWLLLAVARR